MTSNGTQQVNNWITKRNNSAILSPAWVKVKIKHTSKPATGRKCAIHINHNEWNKETGLDNSNNLVGDV